MDKKQAIEVLKDCLRKQGLNPPSIEICLNALNLSLNWKPKFASMEELERANVFISYSLGIGKRKDGSPEQKNPLQIQYDPKIYYPGLTNIDLARIILNLYDKGLKKPIFAQWEVATALEEAGIKVESTAKPREGYLNTQGVVKQFIKDGLEEYEKIILVVHPLESYRTRALTITELFKRNQKTSREIFHADTSNIRLDFDSIQPWTRSEEDIVNYEIGSRTQHVLYNKTLNTKFFE